MYDSSFTPVINDNKEYSDNIKQLNNLNVPKDLTNDYKELMDLYSNIYNDREEINAKIIDEKVVDYTNYKFLNDTEKLGKKSQDINDKISDMDKKMGIK
jgi:hypothetical protein